MRILIQRVKQASVTVDGGEVASIGKGLLLLIAVGREDGPEDIDYLAGKISKLRIFQDDNGKMNLDIKQVNGSILSVSQFTLYADTSKGNRPGFDQSAGPDTAKNYWLQFNEAVRSNGVELKEGIFAAHMEVELLNDGPVTILIDSKNR